MISPNVRELAFERADGSPLDFKAGQWVSLVLPLEEGEARRAYSIASPPFGDGRFEVAITKVDRGPGSTYLHALEIGAQLRAIGPQGFFTRASGSLVPGLSISKLCDTMTKCRTPRACASSSAFFSSA